MTQNHKKYVIYANGGSGNHGCEAIVRGTQQLLPGDYIIQSRSIEEDTIYGINAELRPEITGEKSKIGFLKAYLKLKIAKNYFALDALDYISAIKAIKGQAKVALSVGGDNYCYTGEEFLRGIYG